MPVAPHPAPTRLPTWAALAAGALLAGCAAAPLSFIDSRPVELLKQDEYPVRIVSVDGRLNFQPDVQLDPGVRTLVLEAAGPSPRDGLQKTYAFLVAPCTRYVFIASRETPLARDWKLGVQRRDPVPGCDPKKEAEKAGKN